MAVFDSPITTYSDTTPHKRVITDVISLIDPVDTPCIVALGGLDGASSKFRFTNQPGKVLEWLEDTHAPLTDALNEAATISSTVTTITVGDASYYEVGYIIEIDSEHLWVSSTDVANNILTVTRGVAGTTNASHDSVADVAIVGEARVEGAESDPVGFTDRTTGSNVTQIFHQEVKVTRTHAILAQYGIADEMAYQRDKATQHLMRLVELHLLRNQGLSAGSATAARIMGGLQAFISTNKIACGGALSQALFEEAVMSCYNAGGSGSYAALLNPVNMQKVKNFYDSEGVASATILRVGRDEREIGMNIDRINTPFGVVDLVMDRWSEADKIPILDLQHVGMLTYDPLAWEPLAKTGDYERQQVVGEYTLCMRQEKAHALMTNVG